MANAKYNSFKKDLANGLIDLENDTFKAMLVTDAYAPDIDAHSKRSDVTNEAAGTGYVAGGVVITNPVLTQENGTDQAKWDADDINWPSSTITARAVVIYKSRGGAASADELVGYFDLGENKSSSNGDFGVQWNANGILLIS